MRCPKCKIEGDGNFYPSTLKRTGHNRLCKKCHNEVSAVYRQTPKQKLRQSVYAKNYRASKPEYFSQYRKDYLQRYKSDVYAHYGNKCSCCGESHLKFLTLDHKNNDGYKHKAPKGYRIRGSTLFRQIISEGYPEYYQLLCWNCNCGKRMNNGICPHAD